MDASEVAVSGHHHTTPPAHEAPPPRVQRGRWQALRPVLAGHRADGWQTGSQRVPPVAAIARVEEVTLTRAEVDPAGGAAVCGHAFAVEGEVLDGRQTGCQRVPAQTAVARAVDGQLSAEAHFV